MSVETYLQATGAKRQLSVRHFCASFEDDDDCVVYAMAADPSTPDTRGSGSRDKSCGRGSPSTVPVFLTSVEVANMLRLAPKTLEKMRLEKRGPPYIRLGNSGRAKVIYRLVDVEEWVTNFRRPSAT